MNIEINKEDFIRGYHQAWQMVLNAVYKEMADALIFKKDDRALALRDMLLRLQELYTKGK